MLGLQFGSYYHDNFNSPTLDTAAGAESVHQKIRNSTFSSLMSSPADFFGLSLFVNDLPEIDPVEVSG